MLNRAVVRISNLVGSGGVEGGGGLRVIDFLSLFLLSFLKLQIPRGLKPPRPTF